MTMGYLQQDQNGWKENSHSPSAEPERDQLLRKQKDEMNETEKVEKHQM